MPLEDFIKQAEVVEEQLTLEEVWNDVQYLIDDIGYLILSKKW
jgi:hypothetical protein